MAREPAAARGDTDTPSAPRSQWLKPLVGGCVVIVLLVAAYLAWALYQASAWGRTAAETAREFYQAQAAGDCERLLDLQTTASWSADGRLSRERFLAECAVSTRAVDVAVADAVVKSESDGRAVVALSLQRSKASDVSLHREGGSWKVVTGGAVRIGSPPDQVVEDYLRSYLNGDCTNAAGLVSRHFWSTHGRPARTTWVDGCTTAANKRAPTPRLSAARLSSDLSFDENTATARVGTTFKGARGTFIEPVTWVYEDLGWKLADGTGVPGPLAAPEAIDLGNLALPQVPLVKTVSATGGPLDLTSFPLSFYPGKQTSTLEDVQRLGYRYGYSRLFRAEDDRQFLLNLFVFDTRANARTAVDLIADDYRRSHAGDESTAVEQAPVSEIAGGRGMVARSGGEAPPMSAFVVAAQANIVVKVEAVDFVGDVEPGPLAVAVGAVRAQFERL